MKAKWTLEFESDDKYDSMSQVMLSEGIPHLIKAFATLQEASRPKPQPSGCDCGTSWCPRDQSGDDDDGKMN